MKNLLLLSVLCFTSFSISAQDLIELVSGEEISGWVLEVGYEIRYQRADFPDGPIYVLSGAKVRKIIYATGFEEVINGEEADNSSFYAAALPLRTHRNKFYEGNQLIERGEFMQHLKTQDNVYDTFKSGRATLIGGEVVAVSGLIISLTGSVGALRNFGNTQKTPPSATRAFGGIGISLLGIVIAVAGGKKMDKAVESYNFQLESMGNWKPTLSRDRVGLVWNF